MSAWFVSLHPTSQALLAGLFTWAITAIGTAAVFWTSQVHRKLLDFMLGFSGGVMLAASYWSLLAPAIEIAEHGPLPAWLPPLIGFLLGGTGRNYLKSESAARMGARKMMVPDQQHGACGEQNGSLATSPTGNVLFVTHFIKTGYVATCRHSQDRC